VRRKSEYKKTCGKGYKRGDVDGEIFIAPKLSDSLRERRKHVKVLPLLRVLQDFKPKSRRSILLSHLDDESCEALYEAVANVMLSDSHPSDCSRKTQANPQQEQENRSPSCLTKRRIQHLRSVI
jgi:hypothetical protein